ncbi:hypothetical protein AK812_SmicGene11267 [Symbiodinium microadriaticum]|uniref:Uncharacterized protein n=1 Tax=Symbiodinium microadriaticum TaxID=2951 RepID=A0A1Q9EDN8_SYMMI|nr:hypothetical protein AK812_SmicGene11267 [Symbiodinium microadriaticum]
MVNFDMAAYFNLKRRMTEGVAAQRVFGGRERFVVWREAGVGTNTFLCFLGRDIAALAEVLLASLSPGS